MKVISINKMRKRLKKSQKFYKWKKKIKLKKLKHLLQKINYNKQLLIVKIQKINQNYLKNHFSKILYC